MVSWFIFMRNCCQFKLTIYCYQYTEYREVFCCCFSGTRMGGSRGHFPDHWPALSLYISVSIYIHYICIFIHIIFGLLLFFFRGTKGGSGHFPDHWLAFGSLRAAFFQQAPRGQSQSVCVWYRRDIWPPPRYKAYIFWKLCHPLSNNPLTPEAWFRICKW